MRVLRLTIAGLICAASAPALADGHWYAGVSAGLAEANDIGFRDIDDGSALSSSVSNDDTGWKLFGGYAYNRYISLEFAYIDLGEVSIDATSDGNGVAFAPGSVKAAIESSGFSMAVVAAMPVNDKIELHAKLGYFAWSADQSLRNSAFDPVATSIDGSDPSIGLGASYRLSDKYSIRVEYEKFTDIDEVDGSLLSIGLSASF